MARGFPEVGLEAWRQRVREELGGDEPESLAGRDRDGIRVGPLHTPEDLEGIPERGLPGAAPYVRGGSRDASWQLLARLAAGRAEAAREAAAAELEGGADGLWLRPARPGDPRQGDGGGVVLRHPGDVETLLGGLGGRSLTLVLDAGAEALPVSALLLPWLEAARKEGAAVCFTAAADPLGALAARGRLPMAMEECRRELVELVEWLPEGSPGGRAVAASSLPYEDAGCTPAQELGLVVATMAEYLRWLDDAGTPPALAAEQIALVLALGRDHFETMAKLRAARLLWSRLLVACGVDSPPRPWILAVSSRRGLGGRDVWVNALRVTGHLLAGAVGGADAMVAATYDQPLGAPGPLGRRLARNTHLILREEARLGAVGDPGGGSYYLEVLTEELARAAWALLRRLEGEGGMTACLVSGRVGELVEEAWSRWREELETRSAPLVGVSDYADPDEAPPRRAREPQAREEPPEEGDPGPGPAVSPGALPELARRGASLSGLAAGLERCGETRIPRALPRRRDGASFEDLRARTDALAIRGRRPRILLVGLGPVKRRKERAAWSRRLFQVGGLEVLERTLDGAGPEKVADELEREGCALACLCAAEEDYGESAVELAAALRRAGAHRVLVAGRGGPKAGALRQAGVDWSVHQGVNLRALLERLVGEAEGASP